MSAILGETSPEAIVAAAKIYLVNKLGTSITAKMIAKEIGTSVADLKASIRFVTGTDLNALMMQMRLDRLYSLIVENPERDTQELAEDVGLTLDDESRARFEQAFWMTPEELHSNHATGFIVAKDIDASLKKGRV